MRANRTQAATSRNAALALCVLCGLVLAGCADTGDYDGARHPDAQVSEDYRPAATYYTVVVHSGDSISRIAARYDSSSEAVARANNLDINTAIHPGEVLHIPADRDARAAVLRDATNENAGYAPMTRHDREIASEDPAIAPRHYGEDRVIVRAEPDITPRRAEDRERLADRDDDYAPSREHHDHIVPQPRIADNTPAVQTLHSGESLSASNGGAFIAPVSGRIIAGFGDSGSGQRNDGINIAAPMGTPIRAAAEGTVTYAGNELKGYGNLILIKHDGDYVTAYAHAASIGVTRGQHVAKGDVIGTVGQTGDVTQPQLHFEVRRDMKPVDPRPLVMASAS